MNQVQFQAPPLSRINKVILITAGAVFLLTAILQAVGALQLQAWLGLSGAGVFQGLIFQLVTYPFVDVQLMGFVFSALIIWFIGSELERNWGEKIYLRFLLITVVGVGLLHLLVNSLFFFGTPVYHRPIFGLSGINFALLTAYAMLYPERQLSFMMIFPMKARTFCLILAGIEAYLAIFTSFATSWPHLFAMGIAFLIIRFQTLPLVRNMLHSTFKAKSKKKNHLYVVKEDEQKPPKCWH